jgi:hypothetical protein
MTSLATNMSVRTNLQYIAVAELRNEVFQYSTSTVNFRTTGTFTAPYRDGQTQAVSIPAGTILVETGKKLYRGPNPNVPTFLVQVMAFTNGSSTDGRVVRTPGNGQSLLDATDKAVFGFIDPSSPNVALYSVERNPDHADGLYYSSLALLTAGGAATTAAGYAAAGGVAHKGPSLFTDGSLTANSLTVSANKSATIAITRVAATNRILATYTVPTGHGITAGQTVTVTGLGALTSGGATVSVVLASPYAIYLDGFITYTSATHSYVVGQFVTTAFTAGTNTAGFTVTNAVIVSVPSATTFVIRGPASAPSALGGAPAGTVISPNMNVVNAVVATAGATTFTVNGGFTNITAIDSTGTATVSGGSITTVGTAGLTLAGAFVQRIATTLPTSTGANTTAIDLSLGNIFLQTNSTTGGAVATTYVFTNSIVGTVFTLVITNGVAQANTYVFPANVVVIASPGAITGTDTIQTLTAPAAVVKITCLCVVTA